MPIYKGGIEKSIAIYGVGLEGEKFYWNNIDKFEIVYAIDKQTNIHDFHGIGVYSIDYVVEKLPRLFIVVTCGLNIYKEIAGILKEYGFVEFKDYIWHEFINREMVILYGNCHMSAIEKYLMNNPYFNKKYFIKRICVTEEQPSRLELEACDMIISQDINEENKLGVFSAAVLFGMVSDTCLKILVPNLFGYNLFFPQLYESEEWKRHLLFEESDSEVYKAGVRRIGIADENIKKLCNEGKEIGDIVDIIKNGIVYSEQSIINNFEAQMERIKAREEKCDIMISDFIEDNYRDKKLFFEPGHPSDDVLYEMGRRICKLLHIPLDEKFLPPSRMDTNELFIYGCVYKALNLKFEQDYVRRCDYSATIYNRPIDLNEYVRQSIIWLYKDK